MRGYRKLISGAVALAALTIAGFLMANDNYGIYATSVKWLLGIVILGNTGVHWAQVLNQKQEKRK